MLALRDRIDLHLDRAVDRVVGQVGDVAAVIGALALVQRRPVVTRHMRHQSVDHMASGRNRGQERHRAQVGVPPGPPPAGQPRRMRVFEGVRGAVHQRAIAKEKRVSHAVRFAQGIGRWQAP